MVMLCCCPRFLHKTKHQIGEDASHKAEAQALPTRPAPARLSPLTTNRILTLSQSTAAQSTLTNPLPGADADLSVHLAELVVDDSEDENGDDEAAYTHRNRSTSTLEAVKARIRLHLSQDSIPGPTETDEQIARRAEVKRLMRKRIREELQGENNSIPGGPSTLQPPAPPSAVPANFLNNGPRDTIEFMVDEVTNEQELEVAKTVHLSDSTARGVQHISRAVSKRSSTRSSGKENRRLLHSPTSLHDGNEQDSEEIRSGHHRHVRQRSSMPAFPVSPQLQPVHVASLHDTVSMESWRLSLSAERLADLLTPEKARSSFKPVTSPASDGNTVNADADNAKVHKSPAPPEENTANNFYGSQVPPEADHPGRRLPKSTSLVRDESPVGLWLRAQSQHFHLSLASRFESECQPDSEADSQVMGSPLDQSRGVDGVDAQMDSSELSQASRVATRKQRAETAALLSGDEVVQKFQPGLNAISINPSGHSSAEDPLPLATCEVSQISSPLNAGTPLQKVARRRFVGIRLPSFRCEMQSFDASIQSADNGQGAIQPAEDRKN